VRRLDHEPKRRGCSFREDLLLKAARLALSRVEIVETHGQIADGDGVAVLHADQRVVKRDAGLSRRGRDENKRKD